MCNWFFFFFFFLRPKVFKYGGYVGFEGVCFFFFRKIMYCQDFRKERIYLMFIQNIEEEI
jgi:hypothetical protein